MIPLRDANPTRRLPIVTVALIAASVLVFLYELSLESARGGRALDRFFGEWGVVPADVTAALRDDGALVPALVALVSSQFIHAGWLHLGGNMLYLWIFGNNVEDRLGHVGYLLFYLAGGVIAGLAQVAVDPTSRIPLVGASGAISAALGAYLVLYPHARVLALAFLGFFYQLVEVPAVFLLGFWFVLQLITGVTSLGAPAAVGGGVAVFAHLGGFVAGVLVGLLLRRRRPRGMVVG